MGRKYKRRSDRRVRRRDKKKRKRRRKNRRNRRKQKWKKGGGVIPVTGSPDFKPTLVSFLCPYPCSYGVKKCNCRLTWPAVMDLTFAGWRLLKFSCAMLCGHKLMLTIQVFLECGRKVGVP